MPEMCREFLAGSSWGPHLEPSLIVLAFMGALTSWRVARQDAEVLHCLGPEHFKPTWA